MSELFRLTDTALGVLQDGINERIYFGCKTRLRVEHVKILFGGRCRKLDSAHRIFGHYLAALLLTFFLPASFGERLAAETFFGAFLGVNVAGAPALGGL